MNTHKQMSEYYQAMADGKELQYFKSGDMSGYWVNSPTKPTDALSLYVVYRIKPQPEVIYSNRRKSDGFISTFSTEKSAELNISSDHAYEYIAKRFIAEE